MATGLTVTSHYVALFYKKKKINIKYLQQIK